ARKQNAKARYFLISRRLLTAHGMITLPRLRGRVGRGPAASPLAHPAKACPLCHRFARLPPRKRGRNFVLSDRPVADYGSAGTAFLGIGAISQEKPAISQGMRPPGARFTTYSSAPNTVLGPVSTVGGRLAQ